MNIDVEKKFDEMLNSADLTKENPNKENGKLSDEQLKKLIDGLESEDTSMATAAYNSIVNGGHDYKEQETKAVVEVPLIDPATGMHMPGMIDQQVAYDEDISIDDIMSLDGDVDLTSTEITEDDIKSGLNEVFPDMKIEDGDIECMIQLSERYKNNDDIPYYSKLTDNLKAQIDIALGTSVLSYGDKAKTAKKQLTEQLLAAFVHAAINRCAIIDLNTATGNALNELSKTSEEVMDNIFDLQHMQYTVNYPARAEELFRSIENGEIKDEDMEKVTATAQNYKDASEMYIQAYTYDMMMDAFRRGKCKVKKIQLEKFKRTCEEFDNVYAKSQFSINTVKLLPPVLDRQLDASIDMDDIKRFIVVFINYTRTMKPSVVGQHTFMYYFIKNILNLEMYDHTKSNQAEFYDKLKARLNECVMEVAEFYKRKE